MDYLINILLLALGFVMLVKGSDFFVDGASGIATKFGIPQLIVGLTIVAMGTSAPEAAVSLAAAFSNNAEITVGNVLGSNILNVLIILGLSSVVFPLVVQKKSLIVDIPLVIFSSLLILVLGLDGTIGRIDGIILLVVFVAFIIYQIWDAKKQKSELLSSEQDSKEENKNDSLVKLILFTVIGLAVVILGSKAVVYSASNLALKLGFSERFVGLTVVALGTSLPELFTSVTAAMKKNSDIAIGNIIGSNIFNILFVVGLSSVIIPIGFAKDFIFDGIISLISVVLLLLLCLPKKRLGRIGGVIFLIGYILYFIKIF